MQNVCRQLRDIDRIINRVAFRADTKTRVLVPFSGRSLADDHGDIVAHEGFRVTE
jgi:hypothetical protein